jgi:hypothetical protein
MTEPTTPRRRLTPEARDQLEIEILEDEMAQLDRQALAIEYADDDDLERTSWDRHIVR